MSMHNLSIPDFGRKLDILLKTGAKNIHMASQLSKLLGIAPDILSRLKTGTRTVPQHIFSKLCEIYEIDGHIWFSDLNSFGRFLGLTPQKVSILTGGRIPGIDFSSRITDMRMIGDIHATIKGYWYSYYYSVSCLGEKLVSRDLCVIKDINEDGFIECEIVDNYFSYTGVCFPIKGMLYFFLEKNELFNEIIVYVTNLPDRKPPKLNGVILCLSGGVDEMSTYPSASKVAFRYIGRSEDIPRIFKINDESIDSYMKKNMPAYLKPEEDIKPENIEVYDAIDNRISIDSIPFALRAK